MILNLIIKNNQYQQRATLNVNIYNSNCIELIPDV